MSGFKPPSTLSLEEYVADNCRRWKQRFQLYMEATGAMTKPGKQRAASFSYLVGEDALEIYDTHSLSTVKHKRNFLLKKFADYCDSRRNITI